MVEEELILTSVQFTAQQMFQSRRTKRWSIHKHVRCCDMSPFKLVNGPYCSSGNNPVVISIINIKSIETSWRFTTISLLRMYIEENWPGLFMQLILVLQYLLLQKNYSKRPASTRQSLKNLLFLERKKRLYRYHYKETSRANLCHTFWDRFLR